VPPASDWLGVWAARLEPRVQGEELGCKRWREWVRTSGFASTDKRQEMPQAWHRYYCVKSSGLPAGTCLSQPYSTAL